MKKILDQSTLQVKLYDNLGLVIMDELQKLVSDTKSEKVNPQEPPSIIPPVTNVQPLVQIPEDTSNKVDIISKIDIVEKSTMEVQVATIEIGQIDLFAPTSQGQGAIQMIVAK